MVAAFAKPESAKPKHNLMDPSPILELNAFVPAKDFGLSKQFYSDLGFTLLWGDDGDCAVSRPVSFTFLLQIFTSSSTRQIS